MSHIHTRKHAHEEILSLQPFLVSFLTTCRFHDVFGRDIHTLGGLRVYEGGSRGVGGERGNKAPF